MHYDFNRGIERHENKMEQPVTFQMSNGISQAIEGDRFRGKMA
jgi:hypothetical protein